ncbi:DUF7475 family protein [Halonotius pteroides]|jgi:hypothetical protein|uniref:Uncharacterized protein n=1 Tax=Halonotius pteroides TaxID=268735 RepID=A0A3A6QRD9_9EURY|nr:hypothetical protein [Halonotius pteroides]RJX50847.1 hypothetical protein DP106_04435 [Halonotius pteroides]
MSTNTGGLSVDTEPLGGLAYVGIIAAVISAVIHLRLGVGFIQSPLGISFILAGLGFLGAVGLVLVNYRRRTVYAVGIPFTAVQIGIWYYVNFAAGGKAFPADIGTIGAIDKVAQLVLIVVLIALLR